jgi:hypothetical protein
MVDPIISSKSLIATKIAGFLGTGAILSLPAGVWIDFATSAASDDWQDLVALPFVTKNSERGIEIVDQTGAVIATAEIASKDTLALGRISEVVAILNELGNKYGKSRNN